MITYPNQPNNAEEILNNLKDVLTDNLPECEVNRWFITSVHFANMLDKIKEMLSDD